MNCKTLLAIATIVVLGPFTIEESHCSPKAPFVSRSGGCICYYLYDPICSSENITYMNACELNCVRRQRPYIIGLCKGECPCCKPAYHNEPIWYDDGPGWGWDSGWGWSRLSNTNVSPKAKTSDGISIRYKGDPIESNRTATETLSDSEMLEVAEN